MGRSYAGILGPLACVLVIARGLIAGASAEPTLLAASAVLFGFGCIGYVAGQVADALVRESVRGQFESAMADWNERQATRPAKGRAAGG